MASLAINFDDETVDRLADLIAARVAAASQTAQVMDDRWMTTAEAARYLGLSSANALHRLTADRKLPFAQDKPGAKCWFRRSDLDAWRLGTLP